MKVQILNLELRIAPVTLYKKVSTLQKGKMPDKESLKDIIWTLELKGMYKSLICIHVKTV